MGAQRYPHAPIINQIPKKIVLLATGFNENLSFRLDSREILQNNPQELSARPSLGSALPFHIFVLPHCQARTVQIPQLCFFFFPPVTFSVCPGTHSISTLLVKHGADNLAFVMAPRIRENKIILLASQRFPHPCTHVPFDHDIDWIFQRR